MSASREQESFERELREVPLPENATLRCVDEATNGPRDLLLDESESDSLSLRASREWFQASIPGIGTLEVTGGNEVLVIPDPSSEPADIAPYLEGAAAAVLLAQRGTLALHANAVRIAGSVVAISGPQGAGKSTTAMRLVQRGHALLADDLCPLQVTETEVLLQGTGRRPRLTPETVASPPDSPAAALGRAVERVARVMPWRPRCLPQAIATRRMLTRRHIPSRGHLGVVGTAPLETHAWVTVDGAVVQGGPLGQVSELCIFE